MKQLHLKIYGQVQGVFYRAETEKKAKELGLLGWVKNCPGGCVELVAQGKEQDLKKLLEWCKLGPPAAKVEKVEEEWVEIEVIKFDKFSINL